MADSQRANKLAQELGFVRAEYLTNWRGYEVYEPIVADDGEIYNVAGALILQNDKECRWTTGNEWADYNADESVKIEDI